MSSNTSTTKKKKKSVTNDLVTFLKGKEEIEGLWPQWAAVGFFVISQIQYQYTEHCSLFSKLNANGPGPHNVDYKSQTHSLAI
jgi:hypothetical protein